MPGWLENLSNKTFGGTVDAMVGNAPQQLAPQGTNTVTQVQWGYKVPKDKIKPEYLAFLNAYNNPKDKEFLGKLQNSTIFNDQVKTIIDTAQKDPQHNAALKAYLDAMKVAPKPVPVK